MSYFRGCFLFNKTMVHSIVFLTSFLNSETRKTYKLIYWKLKHYKNNQYFFIQCAFWGEMGVSDFRRVCTGGYWVQISKSVVDSLMLLKPTYKNRVSRKNRINNPSAHSVLKTAQLPATMCTRCVRVLSSPRTQCGAIFLNMHEDNAAAWRQHSALDSALCGRGVVFQSAVRALCARRVRAAKTLC